MARLRIWYATLVVAVAVVFTMVPAARPGALVASALLGVAAIAYGVLQMRPARANAWWCLAGALIILAVGDAVFLIMQTDSPSSVPYPAVPDVVTMVGYYALSVALFWLGRPAARQRDEASLIDAMSVTLAIWLVVWIGLVRPVVEDEGLGTPGRVTAVFALGAYVAVFAAAVRLTLGWRRNAAVVLLGLSLIWFLVSELFYGYQIVRTDWAADGRRVDLGYIALAAGCGAAALTRSMRDVAPPASGRHSLRPWRLAVIAAALLVAPVILAIEQTRGPVFTGISIAVGGALVCFLALVRLSMSGRAYAARAAREGAVRVASQAMLSAMNPKQVLAGTRGALRSLLPILGHIDVEWVDGPDSHRPTRTVLTGHGDRGEYSVPLNGTESTLVFSAPVRVLHELADLLQSLADQASVALHRIRLAEAAGAEERDRYFRTLVLTSTDVILISRHGRIEYATPSAEPMFGRSILGERFEDVVRTDGRRDVGHGRADVAEGIVARPQGDATVVIHRRDLTGDPTVRGVVTTLRDVTAERALQRDLAYRASHDELTGMVNARTWAETLSAERDRRRGPGDGAAVLFIDLDDFKGINDRYGHPTGDQVLAEVARRIREWVRAGDLAARIGGDEFAVLMRGLAGIGDARAVARRVAAALSRPVVVGTEPIDCRASVGLAYSEGEQRVESLVRRADSALYSAKKQGKGRWAEYGAAPQPAHP